MSQPDSRSRLIGFAAATLTAFIGAFWYVTTRAGVTSTLKPIDLALFRFCIPALLLSPILIRHGLWTLGASPLAFGGVLIGTGLPYTLVAMSGAQYAPTAHLGTLLPGTIPIFTALAEKFILRQPITPRRWAGFGVVTLGVMLIGGQSLAQIDSGTAFGDALFIGAAMMWTLYVLSFRFAGFRPWHSTALVALISALVVVPLWLLSDGAARMAATPLPNLLVFATAQGLLAGTLGMWAYSLTIHHLGAQMAVILGAAAPALATLGGWLALGEKPGALVLAGVALTMIGVTIASLRPKAAAEKA